MRHARVLGNRFRGQLGIFTPDYFYHAASWRRSTYYSGLDSDSFWWSRVVTIYSPRDEFYRLAAEAISFTSPDFGGGLGYRTPIDILAASEHRTPVLPPMFGSPGQFRNVDLCLIKTVLFL